ncbi:hypothetical protein [Caulobacter sp. RHG1]|uniref:hypothetical protein n=1 Tax=Caulobacter sp. (strain RHG1) TaxID=2545762 RepID=UPI001557A313|nr:hypothetical protein [Caulobacter sp. RHG1]NQE63436.1 hypothetical protein [Caulobacter sp. RHG1]
MRRVVPSSLSTPAGLAAVLDAAIACRGDMDAMRARLRIGAATFQQHLSRLRTRKFAEVVTAIAPSLTGPVEARALIRLTLTEPETITAFEASILADPAILKADRLSGDYDYRLWVAHEDFHAAQHWVRAWRARPEVLACRYEELERQFGHEAQGVILHSKIRRRSKSKRP